MKSSDSSRGIISEINIAPLVDVILVLLIIFMATAPLIHRRSINVNVPQAAHSESKATATLKVILNEKRELFLSENRVTLEELKYQMTVMLRTDPLLHVAILADQSIPYGGVVEVLDTIRGAGAKKVALEVRSKKVE